MSDERKIEIFVEVFEQLDYETLCLVAAQALLRAVEKTKREDRVP